jgi:hypothetical protein
MFFDERSGGKNSERTFFPGNDFSTTIAECRVVSGLAVN